MASDYDSSTIVKNIPEDLWIAIFCRLPIKTLIKLRCVCKKWKSLFSTTSFINDHFNFNASTTNQPPIFLRLNERSYLSTEYNLRCDNPDLQSLLSNHTVESFDVIHGVVCLVHYLIRGFSYHQSISFWNPTVKKYVSIPCPVDSYFSDKPNLIGFGFVSSKNDFRVVWCSTKMRYYMVFSVRDLKWGRKKKLPEYVKTLNLRSKSCFVNGKIHWLTSTERGYLHFGITRAMITGSPHELLLFDCELEEFSKVDLPEQVSDVNGNPRVFAYGGLLTVLTVSDPEPDDKWETKYELWTTKEYGVASVGEKIDYKSIDIHKISTKK